MTNNVGYASGVSVIRNRLTIVEPEAGTLWLAGDTVEIRWVAKDIELTDVRLGLFKDRELVQMIPAELKGTHSITWQVPEDVEWGDDYHVRLEGGGGRHVDESLVFRIEGPIFGWERHVISSLWGGPDGARFVDTNDDGLLDIVSAYESSGQVMLYQNPGLDAIREEWPGVEVGNVPRGEDAFGIDLDDNGIIDVVSSHEGDTLGLYVHWAPENPDDYLDSTAWQTELFEQSQGRAWMYAIAMDVNEDGHMDIVAGSKDDFYNNRNADGEMGWFESPPDNKRDLSAWQYHLIDRPGWTMNMIPYDVDLDGDLDIVMSDRDADEEHQGVRWVENPGKNWEREWKTHFLGDTAGTWPMFMAIGDLDGDSVDEFIAPESSTNEVIIVRRDEADDQVGLTTSFVTFEPTARTGSFKGIQVADIDMDGRLDLFLTFANAGNGLIAAGWLRNVAGEDGIEWEWNDVSGREGVKMDQAFFYDFDHDGDLDVITTDEGDLGIIWFENPLIE
ncbi:MAG: VCBS repeat-containing protein [Chloroflexi bacterium]|nr:VCBS repeat-containing protein [Chloroflexota bacterium]